MTRNCYNKGRFDAYFLINLNPYRMYGFNCGEVKLYFTSNHKKCPLQGVGFKVLNIRELDK